MGCNIKAQRGSSMQAAKRKLELQINDHSGNGDKDDINLDFLDDDDIPTPTNFSEILDVVLKKDIPSMKTLTNASSANMWCTVDSLQGKFGQLVSQLLFSMDLVNEQLDAVKQLQILSKTRRKKKGPRILRGAALRKVFKSKVTTIFASEETLIKEKYFKEQQLKRQMRDGRRNKMLKKAVKTSVLDKKLNEIRSKFDPILRKKGIDEKSMKLYEQLFKHENLEKFLSEASENKIFVKAHSLTEVYKTNNTITVENLLKILQKHLDIPVLNVLEWKYLKMKEVEDEPIRLEDIEDDKIDWISVAEILWFNEKWHMNPAECRLLWQDMICPLAEIYHVANFEKDLIELIADQLGYEWGKVGRYMNLPAKVCQAIYDGTSVPYNLTKGCNIGKPSNNTKSEIFLTTWKRLRRCAFETYFRFNGSYSFAAAQLNNLTQRCSFSPQAVEKLFKETLMTSYWTKKKIVNHYEDAILLVMVLKLKPIIQMFGKFSCLQTYLPWRSADEWENRLKIVTRAWDAPLTIEEDAKLIYLANLMPGKWATIAKYLDNTDRKYLCQHHRSIQNFIDNETGTTLVDFHKKYGSKQPQVNYPNLKNCLAVLRKVCSSSKPTVPTSRHRRFKGWNKTKPMGPDDFQEMLYLMDRNMLEETCKAIQNFLSRNGHDDRPASAEYRTARYLSKQSQKFEETNEIEWDNTNVDQFDDWGSKNSLALFEECMSPVTSDVENTITAETDPLDLTLSPEYIFPDTPDFYPFRESDAQHLRNCHSYSNLEVKSPPKREWCVPVHKRGKKSFRISQLRKQAAKSRWERRRNQAQEVPGSDHSGNSCETSGEETTLYYFKTVSNDEHPLPSI